MLVASLTRIEFPAAERCHSQGPVGEDSGSSGRDFSLRRSDEYRRWSTCHCLQGLGLKKLACVFNLSFPLAHFSRVGCSFRSCGVVALTADLTHPHLTDSHILPRSTMKHTILALLALSTFATAAPLVFQGTDGL